MGFAASQKSVTSMVASPMRRASRFFQTTKSLDRLARLTPKQKGTRTSTNPARSVGTLRDDVK